MITVDLYSRMGHKYVDRSWPSDSIDASDANNIGKLNFNGLIACVFANTKVT